MSYSDLILPEFDEEMASTRKVLERVPEDRLDWKPHPKSNTIGWNANHLADLPSWGVMALTNPSFDFEPVGGKRWELPKLTTQAALVDLFDRQVADCRKLIASAKEPEWDQPWSLLQGGNVLMTVTRRTVIRSWLINHAIHHRAILCVYLRLNDIPVPGMYGPSGDE